MQRIVSKRITKYLFIIISVIFICLQASAAPIVQDPINYGNPVGMTVKYFDIEEDSETDPIYDGGGNPIGLYGAPVLFQDTLQFPDLLMMSYSSGLESDITDGVLSGIIEAKPNHYIDTVHFMEWGDVTLTGLVNEAIASISNTIFITILEIDGVGAVNIPLAPVNMVINPPTGDGDWALTVDGRITGEIWGGDLFVDVSALAGGDVTRLSFIMDNTLSTASMEGTSAFIAKKETNGLNLSIQPIIIPEPTTLALLAIGGLAILRKRK